VNRCILNIAKNVHISDITVMYSIVSVSELKSHELINDVIDDVPSENVQRLSVLFSDNTEVKFGDKFDAGISADMPTLDYKQAESNELYTIVMTDPDAPSRADPKFREWVHWAVVNVKGRDIKTGDTIIEYVGSGPPKNTGYHRYCLFVYKQNESYDVSSKYPNKLIAKGGRGEGRGGWKLRNFLKTFDTMPTLHALNMYQAQYDDTVPGLYKMLGL
jgi:phosphatidylethanolamine-binding protein